MVNVVNKELVMHKIDKSDLVATKYEIESEYRDTGTLSCVEFCRMVSPFYEGEKWSVREGCFCLNRSFNMEHEPMPSRRTVDFYSRCRFDSIDEAIRAYNIYNNKGGLNNDLQTNRQTGSGSMEIV